MQLSDLSPLTKVQMHDQEEELSWLSQLKHLSRQMHLQAGNMWPMPHNFSMLSQLTSLEYTAVHLFLLRKRAKRPQTQRGCWDLRQGRDKASCRQSDEYCTRACFICMLTQMPTSGRFCRHITLLYNRYAQCLSELSNAAAQLSQWQIARLIEPCAMLSSLRCFFCSCTALQQCVAGMTRQWSDLTLVCCAPD